MAAAAMAASSSAQAILNFCGHHQRGGGGLVSLRAPPWRLSLRRRWPSVRAEAATVEKSVNTIRCLAIDDAVHPILYDDDVMRQILDGKIKTESLNSKTQEKVYEGIQLSDDKQSGRNILWQLSCVSCGIISSSLGFVQVAESSVGMRTNMVYEIGELFELGIQLSYLLILLGLLGVGTFYVIRQVLVRRELDLSAKELQEQVRSGDASATGYFELGAVMLRRKFYPAAIKYLQQAIEKWDRDDQDLAQVYNALGVSYVRDNKLDKGITQFETAVKLQPGYVTAWNNLGDAYEKRKDLRAALKAFEEVLLFDPNNKIARPRRDALRERVQLYKGVPIKSEDR